jgi:hypothetical protein
VINLPQEVEAKHTQPNVGQHEHHDEQLELPQGRGLIVNTG